MNPNINEMLLQQAKKMLNAALEAVRGDVLVREQLHMEKGILTISEQRWDLRRFRRILVAGAGKAAAAMASGLEALLGERITAGIVAVPSGVSAPCTRIVLAEAGHPLPDARSVQAGRDILQLVDDAGSGDLVICLFSGGGSALLEVPAGSITLEDLQQTIDLLLACGAEIGEINIIRRHISAVKGGRLLKAIAPAACITLLLSDVIGDDPAVIASGPTTPDDSTFAETLQVVSRYQLQSKLPAAVLEYLEKGGRGEVEENPGGNAAQWGRCSSFLLGNNRRALEAAQRQAQKAGYHCRILSDSLHGEARDAGTLLAGQVQELLSGEAALPRPACLLWGGETTVTLRGDGLGGRNQELLLAAALRLWDVQDPFLILSCGTDGVDGPTDAAGAYFSPEVAHAARRAALDPLEFLQRNDSYHFFQGCGGLLRTGPTGTNVMDLGLILVR